MCEAYSVLRERIRQKFGSQQKFAEVIRMNPKTLSFKLKDKGRFTQQEIIDISDILGLTVYEMMDFFFNKQIENKEEILSKEIHQLTNEIRKASRLMIERRVTNGKS